MCFMFERMARDFDTDFASGMSVDAALDAARMRLRRPASPPSSMTIRLCRVTHDGELITPSVLAICATPLMIWKSSGASGGYYQLDPVQDSRACGVPRRFVWSYVARQSSVMQRVLRAKHAPVVSAICAIRA